MNRKIWEYANIVIKAAVVALLMIQTIFAILWAIQNIAVIPQFYDSNSYIGSADSLMSDGWRLIGYSTILSVFKKIAGDYFYIPVYLIQVIGSLSALTLTIQTIAKRAMKRDLTLWQSILGAWYIITLPIIWQMIFSILPDILCICMLFLEVVMMIEAILGEKRFLYYRFAVLLMITFVLGVTEHFYFYTALIMNAAFILYEIIASIRRKEWWIITASVILIAATALSAVTSGVIIRKTTKDISYVTYSIPAALMDRFVYPGLFLDYANYPEEVKVLFPDYVAKTCSGNLEYQRNSVCPMIENFSDGNEEHIYWLMVKSGINLRTEYNLTRLIKDTAAHVFQPFSMIKYMYNNNFSRYGYNYKCMWMQAPILTKNYMHFSMLGACVSALYGIVAMLIGFIRNKSMRKNSCCALIIFMMTTLVYTLIATLLSVGGTDYRLGNPMMIFWLVIFVLMILPGKEKCHVTEGEV